MTAWQFLWFLVYKCSNCIGNLPCCLRPPLLCPVPASFWNEGVKTGNNEARMSRFRSVTSLRVTSYPHHLRLYVSSIIPGSHPTPYVHFACAPTVLPSDHIIVPRRIFRMYRRWFVRSGHLVHVRCAECLYCSSLINAPHPR